MNQPPVHARLQPGRKIHGAAAVLLPFTSNGEVDWAAFEAHAQRTLDAGLALALDMDTGYVQLIDETTKTRVLEIGKALCPGGFIAGAYVRDTAGAAYNRDAYFREADAIAAHGGTPIVVASYGLSGLEEDDWLTALSEIGELAGQFYAFELGPQFVPFGRIYSLDAYRGLLGIPQCLGAKHSSLQRELEWQRLALRDEVRPDFKVMTGNDLAIDMVMYGSDYLLGLATFAPDLFAKRDAMWESGDPAFYELNDALQYLGAFAFREPVPAYRHNAAQFLQLRGWTATDAAHPEAPTRPESDRAVLREAGRRLGVLS